MRFISLCLLFSLLFSTSSCAYLYAQRDDIDKIIDKWVDEKEYGEALDTLSRVKTSHPNYLPLMLRKKEIIDEAEQFANRSINQANFYISANKWDDAYTIYTFSLDKLPNNKKLKDSYAKYLKKRSAYVGQLEFKLIVSKAQKIINDLPIRLNIATAKTEDQSEKEKYQQLKKQAAQVSFVLAKCAETELINRNIAQASHCINLAKKLKPTKDIKIRLQLVAKNITALRNKKLASKKKQQLRKKVANKIILVEYEAAFQKGDLITANKKMTRLLSLNKNNYEINQLKIKLQDTINNKVQTGIEAGRQLYSKGDIKLALDKWTTLKKLVPNNKELLAHIDRAERVLRNLRKLSNKDTDPVISPPSQIKGNDS